MTASTAPTTAATSTSPARPQRFMHTLASEWSKLFSLRSTYITLALAIILSFGMTALVSLAVGTTFDDWSPTEQADFEPIMFSLVGVVFGLIVFSVFGVLVVSSEYSSGQIRLTFQATPRRGRVLVAKAMIVTVITMIGGMITAVGMFLIGQAVLGAYDMPTVGLDDPDAQRALIAGGLTMPLFPLLGLALGFLLRSTAGGITAVLAILWLPEMFGGLLPLWWRENVVSLLPGPAVDSLGIAHLVDSPTFSEPEIGALIVAAWLVGSLLLAFIVLKRRDA